MLFLGELTRFSRFEVMFEYQRQEGSIFEYCWYNLPNGFLDTFLPLFQELIYIAEAEW